MEPQSKGSVLLVEDHQDIAELVYDYMEGVDTSSIMRRTERSGSILSRKTSTTRLFSI